MILEIAIIIDVFICCFCVDAACRKNGKDICAGNDDNAGEVGNDDNTGEVGNDDNTDVAGNDDNAGVVDNNSYTGQSK